MEYTKLNIYPDHPEAYLTMYRHEVSQDKGIPDVRPAMIVCPGGAYKTCADREAEPVVFGYMHRGFNVFLLQYSLLDHAGDYVPFIEVTHAVAYVRTHAAEYHIDPHQVFVVGFSAGGHLAACSATLWNEPHARQAVSDLNEAAGRPDGIILGYPAIDSDIWKSTDFIFHMHGQVIPDDERRNVLSPERFVTENTPPAFIWQTVTDTGVPVLHSIHYAEALAQHHVPFELRLYPDGDHGLGTATPESCGKQYVASEWLDESARWAKNIHTGSI